MGQKHHPADSQTGAAFPVALMGEATTFEQRFYALVEAAADLVWIINSDGAAREDSPSWRAFTGQPIKRDGEWAWLNILAPDDQKLLRDACMHAIRAQQPCQTECRLLRRDGVYRTCSVRLVPVRSSDGNRCEWMGIARDITEQRLAAAKRTRRLEREQEARGGVDLGPSGIDPHRLVADLNAPG